MNNGKRFENEIKNSIPCNIYFQRIFDQSFDFNSEITRFTKKNPFDCYAFNGKKLFLLELKSTKQKSISIQKDKKDKGKMIKLHQINALKEASNFENIVPGFLFNFRLEINKCYFLHIKNFIEIINNSQKKSINITEIMYHGFKINSLKKKVNYIYELDNFFENYKFIQIPCIS